MRPFFATRVGACSWQMTGISGRQLFESLQTRELNVTTRICFAGILRHQMSTQAGCINSVRTDVLLVYNFPGKVTMFQVKVLD